MRYPVLHSSQIKDFVHNLQYSGQKPVVTVNSLNPQPAVESLNKLLIITYNFQLMKVKMDIKVYQDIKRVNKINYHCNLNKYQCPIFCKYSFY